MVSAAFSETDLDALAAWACGLPSNKIVTKENFSAGKEGVSFVPCAGKTLLAKLHKVRAEAGMLSKRDLGRARGDAAGGRAPGR